MTSVEESAARIRVLMVHKASRAAYPIFNPNDWTDLSKLIVTSCAAQYGLLNYITVRLPLVLSDCEKLCKARFRELQGQWTKAPWDLDKCVYLVETPEFHLQAQAYLATIKVFLDLLAQLITSEGLVNKKVHGFHKKGRQIGGEWLHILDVKAYSAKRDIASQLHQLVEEQKALWIDQAIELRDSLVHPEKGMHQVMFGLETESDKEGLRLIEILHPSIDDQDFGEYAQKTTHHISHFSRRFLNALKAG